MADNKDAGVPALQDPSTSDNVCQTCQGLACLSDSSDSAYEADTIIDSPNSRSSTLKLNVSDSSNDETMLSDTNLNDEEIKEEPAPLMTRRRPLNQEEKLCVQRGCVCKCHEEKEETKEDSEEDL